MTPAQRRELERLIDARERAVMERTIALLRGRPDDAEAEQWAASYRDLMHYLDEVTDYTRAEVSES